MRCSQEKAIASMGQEAVHVSWAAGSFPLRLCSFAVRKLCRYESGLPHCQNKRKTLYAYCSCR